MGPCLHLTACRALLHRRLIYCIRHLPILSEASILIPILNHPCHLNMAPSATSPVMTLETEDHARDAAFNKALHGKSAEARGGFSAMRNKDKAAQKAAVDEYFKHWDNKLAENETEEDRKARRDEYATLTRHYYNLATDLYEYGWGTSFRFCRFAARECSRSGCRLRSGWPSS